MSSAGDLRKPSAAVEAAIDAFVAAWTAGDRPEIDAFCSAHPECGPELRAFLEEFVELRGAVADEPRDAPLGADRTLGDFRVSKEIGRGGMGVVYEAEQISLRRRVALKVLAERFTLRPESVARFRREASTAARLAHPGIVEVFAVGEDRGVHFFAMERIEGESLGDRLDRRRRQKEPPEDPGPTCALIARIADALEFARRAGVVHRDVKPSNVLIRPDGSPVLTDFGLAREEGLPSVTRTGEFAGTPYYLSPEQASGGRIPVDHRTDVYSLGVTLYEALTLHRPFEGDSSNDVLGMLATREPPSPRSHQPLLPRDLETIVLKAIEKDPQRRYPTAGAFASDLRAFLEYRPIVARPAGLATRAGKLVRRHRPFVAAAAVVLAATALALAYRLSRPGSLEIVARDAGATIFVDGNALAEKAAAEGPVRVSLAPGTHRVRVEQLDRALASEEVAVNVGRGSTTVLEPKLASLNGNVELRSSPPGARVTLVSEDGREIPVPRPTPWIWNGRAGRYRARFELAGFEPVWHDLELRPAGYGVVCEQTWATGELVLECDDSGAVVDIFKGEDPGSAAPVRSVALPVSEPIVLPAGVYALRATLAEHEHFEIRGPRAVRLEAGRNVHVRIFLSPVEPRLDAMLEGEVRHLVVADLDGTGLDALVGGSSGGKIAAFERGSARRFETTLEGGIGGLGATHDENGETLIVAGSRLGSVARIARDGSSRSIAQLQGAVTALALADLDADGADEVIASTERGTVAALGLDGTPRAAIEKLGPVAGLVVCDLDRDGALEVVALANDGSVARIGRTEATRLPVKLAAQPMSFAAVQASAEAPLTLFVGLGQGQIVALGADGTTRELPRLDGWIAAIAGVDLDGDGADELVLRSFNGRLVAARGDGTTLFSKQLDRGVAVLRGADVDGDGRVEILTASATGYFTALDARGEVRFTLASRKGPLVIAAPDLDGDGRREVAMGTAQGQITAFGADPWLRMGRTLPYPPARFGVATLSGERLPSVIVGTRTGPPYIVRGDGTMRAPIADEVAPMQLFEVFADPQTGRFYGAGGARPSLFCYGADGKLLWEAPLPEPYSAIHLNRPPGGALQIGVGTWGSVVVFDEEGNQRWRVDAAGLVIDLAHTDFDGDGEAEWIAAIYLLDRVVGFSDSGAERWRVTGLPRVRSVTPVDPRGDGRVQLVVGCEEGEIVLVEKPQPNAWRTIARIRGNAYEIAAGDLDGKPGDEVAVCSFRNTLAAFTLDGSKIFERRFPNQVDDVEIADFDGDGRAEIVSSPNTLLNVAFWNAPRDDPRLADKASFLEGVDAAERGDETEAAVRLGRGRMRWLALDVDSAGAMQWRLRVCESAAARRAIARLDPLHEPTELDAIRAIEELRARERVGAALAVLERASAARPWSPRSAVLLNGIAWSIADPEKPWPPGAPLAIAAATAAVGATERRVANYLDTLAWSLFLAGRTEEALQTEQEALSKCEPLEAGLRPDLERAIERFRALVTSR